MIEQGSPEWYALRAGKITASEFSNVLMTKDKAGYRNYLIRLALERVLGKSLFNGYTNKAMDDGKEREPLARALYEMTTGNLVDEVDFVDHSFMPMVGCSPDGLIGTDGGYESKCPIAATHYSYLLLPNGTIPSEYKPQVQGSLWITGRKWWDFVSYHPDFPERLQLKVVRVYPDTEYIKGLEKACIMFNLDVNEAVTKLNDLAKEMEVV